MTRIPAPPLSGVPVTAVTASPAELSVAEVAAAAGALARRWLPALLPLAVLAGTWVMLSAPSAGIAFLLLAVGCGAGLVLWLGQRRPVLPILPLYLLVQALVYGLPMITGAWKDSVPEGSGLPAGIGPSLLLWFLAIAVGWAITPRRWLRIPPLPTLAVLSGGLRWLPQLLLAMSFAIDLAIRTGLFFELAGPLGGALLTPTRVVASSLATLGGFLGAYRWGRHRLPAAWLWGFFWLAILYLGLSSLLLSSVQGLVVATLLGLWISRSARALPVTLALLLLVAFLNQGKAEMRGRYWDDTNRGGVPLGDPVAVLQEWSAASLQARERDEAQDLFTERVNNLANLLYVQEKLDEGIPTMNGQTYALIPRVVVPRALDPDKPLSQAGQVLLNFHFQRQTSLQQLFSTFIAWGFLPEAVGNFGLFLGPLLVGTVVGVLLRCTENLGFGQPLLSTPGLLSLALTMLWITSYEMVATTFTASAFQQVLGVLLAGWLLSPSPARAGRRR